MSVRMGHIIFGLMVCCVVALLTSRLAHADQDGNLITWQQVVLPPAVIADGYAAGEGYMEQTTNWLITHLPQFQHEKRVIPVAQALNEMSRGTPICSHFLYETHARTDYLVFSDPVLHLKPIRLFLTPDKLSTLRYAMRDGMVDLELMTNQNRLSIGMPIGFRFDDSLVPGFSTFISSQLTHSAGTIKQVVRMYEANRIDGFISYQTNVNYYRHADALTREIIAVPIMGVSTRPLPVSCSGDKERAQEIIEAINALLAAPDNRAELNRFYTRWADVSS